MSEACGCSVSKDGSVTVTCDAHLGYIGKAGVCSKGRPGLIVGRKQLPWGLSWVGIGLDDGSSWSSRSPRVMTRDELVELSDSKVTSETAPTSSLADDSPGAVLKAVTPLQASGAEVFDGE